eukprot:CAMPEP_0114551748 /NCGR_PEP_ID=MMETSP0114-20121206/6766_1 /TAXON_ID=31324 /ORGANISM="Goniomonas sp, Strain m" /LENGTH=481 /DNA_ID=CAMNT_0001736597 /DNA_START=108 /DNA_END=1554 /DNA_ORIENTATION=+
MFNPSSITDQAILSTGAAATSVVSLLRVEPQSQQTPTSQLTRGRPRGKPREPPPVIEAIVVPVEVQRALSTNFTITSVSVEGTFATGPGTLNLPAVVDCFGIVGSSHDLVDGSFVGVMEVDGVVTQQKDNSKQLFNFIVIKFRFVTLSLNVSFKLYTTGYFQAFGFADTPKYSADRVADLVLRWAAAKINDQGRNPELLGFVAPLKTMALSAFHEGVSGSGLRFDIDALERAFTAVHKTNPDLVISRNHRNHSLVVRLGKKAGSQIFHGTGTIQLMGYREHPSHALARLRELAAEYPDIAIINVDGKLRKKRQRGQAAAACRELKRSRTARAELADIQGQLSDLLGEAEEATAEMFFSACVGEDTDDSAVVTPADEEQLQLETEALLAALCRTASSECTSSECMPLEGISEEFLNSRPLEDSGDGACPSVSLVRMGSSAENTDFVNMWAQSQLEEDLPLLDSDSFRLGFPTHFLIDSSNIF